MGLLYGRAGRLTAETGGFWPAPGSRPLPASLPDRLRGLGRECAHPRPSEKDTKFAQKLGQLQPFMAVFLLECTGQLASFGPT
jgi:hypothetical protein